MGNLGATEKAELRKAGQLETAINSIHHKNTSINELLCDLRQSLSRFYPVKHKLSGNTPMKDDRTGPEDKIKSVEKECLLGELDAVYRGQDKIVSLISSLISETNELASAFEDAI